MKVQLNEIVARLRRSSYKQTEAREIVREIREKSSYSERRELIEDFRRQRTGIIQNSDNQDIIDVIEYVFKELE